MNRKSSSGKVKSSTVKQVQSVSIPEKKEQGKNNCVSESEFSSEEEEFFENSTNDYQKQCMKNLMWQKMMMNYNQQHFGGYCCQMGRCDDEKSLSKHSDSENIKNDILDFRIWEDSGIVDLVNEMNSYYSNERVKCRNVLERLVKALTCIFDRSNENQNFKNIGKLCIRIRNQVEEMMNEKINHIAFRAIWSDIVENIHEMINFCEVIRFNSGKTWNSESRCRNGVIGCCCKKVENNHSDSEMNQKHNVSELEERHSGQMRPDVSEQSDEVDHYGQTMNQEYYHSMDGQGHYQHLIEDSHMACHDHNHQFINQADFEPKKKNKSRGQKKNVKNSKRIMRQNIYEPIISQRYYQPNVNNQFSGHDVGEESHGHGYYNPMMNQQYYEHPTYDDQMNCCDQIVFDCSNCGNSNSFCNNCQSCYGCMKTNL